MDATPACRWCGSPSLTRRAYGAKARWIVANPRESHPTDLVECTGCGLWYFTAEFSDDELSTMYSGYRGEEYFARRHRYEPWYTKSLNDSIGHDPTVLEKRRRHLEHLLADQLNTEAISAPTRVLDVGGDEGQFIPQLDGIRWRGVLEVSNVRPVDDVSVVASWDEAKASQPDLVMMCHVLEHVNNPKELLENAVSCLAPNGLLYIEVPLDRVGRVARFMSGRWQRGYTRFVSRHRALFIAADFVSLVSRRVVGLPLPGSVMKQSEHVNFFDRQSLLAVAARYGLTEVGHSTYSPVPESKVWNVQALGVLFVRSH